MVLQSSPGRLGSPPGAHLGDLGALLGATWGALGRSRGALGSLSRLPGAIFAGVAERCGLPNALLGAESRILTISDRFGDDLGSDFGFNWCRCLAT